MGPEFASRIRVWVVFQLERAICAAAPSSFQSSLKHLKAHARRAIVRMACEMRSNALDLGPNNTARRLKHPPKRFPWFFLVVFHSWLWPIASFYRLRWIACALAAAEMPPRYCTH
ncbi:MAG TPA: hypothetical protein DHW63_12970 [Hyphomonadaceae bacterium]|nr:hypothetical protein [Hyphomonadaceae bacterium]